MKECAFPGCTKPRSQHEAVAPPLTLSIRHWFSSDGVPKAHLVGKPHWFVDAKHAPKLAFSADHDFEAWWESYNPESPEPKEHARAGWNAYKQRFPDNCTVCKGAKGGVRGNEVIFNGVRMCDECYMEASHEENQKKKDAEAANDARMNIVNAPFTMIQVHALNEYQQKQLFHPFTCGGEDCRQILIATTRGWICPACDYTQDWAHSWMADEAKHPKPMKWDSPEEELKEARRLLEKGNDFTIATIPPHTELPIGGKSNGTYEIYIAKREGAKPDRTPVTRWMVGLNILGSREHNFVLGRDGSWSAEPWPSKRTDEWIEQYRFDSLDEALFAAEKAQS